MKTIISFNAMNIMLLGIGMVVGGLTGSALAQTDNQTDAEQGKNNTDSGSSIMDKIAQTDNQTDAEQGKNNTDSGSSIMDKIGDVAKEKLKEGVQEIIGGSNNK